MYLSDTKKKEIQNLINQNLSKKKIASILKISEPTLRKIFKNNNFDFSTYKVPGNRKYVPSSKDIDFIKENISKKNKIEIANDLKISLPTLNIVIKEYNIDTSLYKRKSFKIKLTEEQIETLQKMLSNKTKYVEIAKYFNIAKDTIKVLIDRYNLKINKEYQLKEEEKDLIIEMYSKNFSIRKISCISNFNCSQISSILIDNGIKIRQHKNNNENISQDDFLYYTNKFIKIKDRYYSFEKDFTKEEIKYIQENVDKITVEQIAKNLNRFNDEIIFVINKYNFGTTILKYDTIFSLPFGKEFEKDLCNPALTHTTVGRKYGIASYSISQWRKKKYGTFKQRVNIWENKTTAEIAMEKILDDMDYVYVYQKQINKYKFDYYLGHKHIIEVQGDYWHSTQKAKKCDLNKKIFCEKNGYKLLCIYEHELKNTKLVEEKIKNFTNKN